MTSPLKGPIARIIAGALKGILYDLTLRHVTGSHYDVELGEVVTTYANYVCRGFVDTYSAAEKSASGSTIAATDRKIVILAKTLAAVPELNDAIIVDGVDRNVVAIESDPAGATWILQTAL